jgi:PAS domain S-box-containing protein
MAQNPPLSPEELYCFLSEGVTDYAFVTFDPENLVTSWSRGAERILGYREDEILGRPGSLIFTQEDRVNGEVEKELSTALRDGRAEDERWHLRKDRTRFWGSGVMTAIRDNSGRHMGYAKVMRDLTDRRQSEAALRGSEERFRLFVENVREYALFQTDMDGRITSWHPGAERLFGYASAEIVGHSASRLFSPEDREAGVLERELAVVAEGGRTEEARWVVRKDGSRFWARWVTEPLRDEKGQLRGTAKVLRDETEREKVEAALRASQRQFEAVAHLVPDLLWANDANGRVTWNNQRWAEYSGREWDASGGLDWAEVIHREDLPAMRQQFLEAVRSGTSFRHEQGSAATTGCTAGSWRARSRCWERRAKSCTGSARLPTSTSSG